VRHGGFEGIASVTSRIWNPAEQHRPVGRREESSGINCGEKAQGGFGRVVVVAVVAGSSLWLVADGLEEGIRAVRSSLSLGFVRGGW
jgi:hypothetical protein